MEWKRTFGRFGLQSNQLSTKLILMTNPMGFEQLLIPKQLGMYSPIRVLTL